MSVTISPSVEVKEIPILLEKNVVIIGGTSGIGLSVAKMCVNMGAYVTVIGRHINTELATKGVAQIIMDVYQNREGIGEILKYADYVFNNVGFYYKGTIRETTPEKFTEVVAKNTTISYEITRLCLLNMKSGVLVNMSSRPTLDSYHSWSAYTLAKQAIITLTKAAAEESDIKCYSVCPSRVDTKFREALFPREDKKTRLDPSEVAILVLTLFNGLNESGSHYWIKEQS
jgi:2-C-methyl-D-erythritol 4-phosphate cytidylyltransferase